MNHMRCCTAVLLSTLVVYTGCISGGDSASDAGTSDKDAGAGKAGAGSGGSAAGRGGNAGAGAGGSGGQANAGSSAGSGGNAGSGGSAAPGGGNVVQTFVLHEITALSSGLPGAPSNGVISADGRKIGFVQAGNMPNKISIIDFDGSGQREVDSYDSLVGSQAWLDISGDGSALISTDSMQVRYVKADGSGKKTIANINSNEIGNIRISEDGTKVFYMLGRNAADTMTGNPVERGIYTVKPDGTGKQLVVGTAAVAALYGVMPDEIFRFDTCGRSLDVSANGNRIVFSINVTNPTSAGNKILGVNADGSGLHKIGEASGGGNLVQKVGIDPNGNKVIYMVNNASNATELVVDDFAGGNKRVLAKTPDVSFGDGCAQSGKLTSDASRVFHSDSGLLFNTDGSAIMNLLVPAPFNGFPLVGDRMQNATMSNDGKRFAFHRADANGRAQLVTLEINPSSLGAAPSISEARITPIKLMKGVDPPDALLSARVVLQGTTVGVGATGLRAGRRDVTLHIPGILADTGKDGDAQAGDGLYSQRAVGASSEAMPGPRTVRIQAENIVDGRRHASVVELGGISLE